MQSAQLSHRVLQLPRRFALLAHTSVNLIESNLRDEMDVFVKGHAITGTADVTAQFQLVRRLGLAASAGAIIPFAESTRIESRAGLGVSAYLLLAFTKWDFSVGGSLGDITRSPSTSAYAAFAKRWGL